MASSSSSATSISCRYSVPCHSFQFHNRPLLHSPSTYSFFNQHHFNSDLNLSVIKLNMKQKIVMKVHMSCQKCRAKALKLVASANGVSFAGLEGDEKEKVVVIGDGVDAVKLTNYLKKKVGHTDILSVAVAK
ncbi:hypothetical protein K1719_007154 [Acacia pycnantha]|nr:hypothetical protein K1719_007154 [Acacia pycnantha]